MEKETGNGNWADLDRRRFLFGIGGAVAAGSLALAVWPKHAVGGSTGPELLSYQRPACTDPAWGPLCSNAYFTFDEELDPGTVVGGASVKCFDVDNDEYVSVTAVLENSMMIRGEAPGGAYRANGSYRWELTSDIRDSQGRPFAGLLCAQELM